MPGPDSAPWSNISNPIARAVNKKRIDSTSSNKTEPFIGTSKMTRITASTVTVSNTPINPYGTSLPNINPNG